MMPNRKPTPNPTIKATVYMPTLLCLLVLGFHQPHFTLSLRVQGLHFAKVRLAVSIAGLLGLLLRVRLYSAY